MQCRHSHRPSWNDKWRHAAMALLTVVWLTQASVGRADDPPAEPAKPVAAAAAVAKVPEPAVEFLPAMTADEQRILDGLSRPVTVEFVEKPLNYIATFIDDAVDHQIPVQFDSRASKTPASAPKCRSPAACTTSR